MPKNVGLVLKELRLKAGMSPQDVIEAYDKIRPPGEYPKSRITAKKLYSYEGLESEPSIMNFLALCEIYGCKNILNTFADTKPDYSIPTDEEWELIEMYRELDKSGRDFLYTFLDHEQRRIDKIYELEETARRKEESEDYTILNAAHARTDIEIPEDTDTTDNDIMESEGF